jgi:hypothetical protein
MAPPDARLPYLSEWYAAKVNVRQTFGNTQVIVA